MNATEHLASRFATMAADEGLVDVKFYVNNSEEASTGDVSREVERLYEALERGDSAILNFQDSRR